MVPCLSSSHRCCSRKAERPENQHVPHIGRLVMPDRVRRSSYLPRFRRQTGDPEKASVAPAALDELRALNPTKPPYSRCAKTSRTCTRRLIVR